MVPKNPRAAARSSDRLVIRGPWLPLLVIVLVNSVVMAVVTDKYLSTVNVNVILANAALVCAIGFSQAVVLGIGGFNLSVGGIGNLTGITLGYLLVEQGATVLPAIALTVVAGAICGLVNGLLIAKSGVNGFVITLATGGAFTGLALGVTETTPYSGLPSALTTFGTGRWQFFPFLLVATIVVAVLLAALYRWTRFGRDMLMVGGNHEAAALSGISVQRVTVGAHVLSGALASIAGIMAAAQLHQANPSAASDWLILSFTVAIIGGTKLTGGSVSVAGLLVAGLILAIIDDVLVLSNVNPYWVTFMQGALVFIAVLVGRPGAWRQYRSMFSSRHRIQEAEA